MGSDLISAHEECGDGASQFDSGGDGGRICNSCLILQASNEGYGEAGCSDERDELNVS